MKILKRIFWSVIMLITLFVAALDPCTYRNKNNPIYLSALSYTPFKFFLLAHRKFCESFGWKQAGVEK